MPEAVFLGSKILVFTAHPDDESYLAAGTIYENTRRGGKTFLVCATGGELGSAHLKKPISPRGADSEDVKFSGRTPPREGHGSL